MTEQNPAPAAPPAPTQPASGAPSPAPEKQPAGTDGFKSEESKASVLADLARERDARQALESRLDAQNKAFAAALGVKPEETSDTDQLAQRIESLQSRILSSEKRALAAEFKVPEHMLTATDADGLRKQASDLAEFAVAAHVAAVTSTPTPPPAFQPNPGQGQGGGNLTPEAQALAEYEKYYPTHK